ncbi:MAG: hypothetical protein VKK97_04325 [Synechococcaceae cyanobacterium]|nr:hypothetical protein [Synechococcaceae cyanobacterium]
MPLPKPPGYVPQRQLRVDGRRILLAGLIFAAAAAVLLLLLRHAAASPGQPLRPLRQEFLLLVILGAGCCGAWNEWLYQIALTRRGESGGPLVPGLPRPPRPGGGSMGTASREAGEQGRRLPAADRPGGARLPTDRRG